MINSDMLEGTYGFYLIKHPKAEVVESRKRRKDLKTLTARRKSLVKTYQHPFKMSQADILGRWKGRFWDIYFGYDRLRFRPLKLIP